MTDLGKSIGEVYEDRNALAIALAVSTDNPSGVYTPEGDEWPVVWVQTPMGQASWHVTASLYPEHVLEEVEPPGGYDDHDRDEKNDRLLRWALQASGEE